jgi:hypothetical protein
VKRSTLRSWRVPALCGAILVAAVLVYGWLPVSPRLIAVAVRAVGPRPVYRLLSDDDVRWERIVAGVETGDAAWLRAAVALYPALDTHPGEEMFAAVSTVLEIDPSGAFGTLLPRYGPEVVCGGPWGEDPMTPAKARRRLAIVRALPAEAATAEAASGCQRVAEAVVRAAEGGRLGGW